MTTATAEQQSDIASLEKAINAERFVLAELRTQAAAVAAELDGAGDDVRRGLVQHASVIPGLLKQQEQVAAQIKLKEPELEAARAKLARQKAANDKAKLHAL